MDRADLEEEVQWYKLLLTEKHAEVFCKKCFRIIKLVWVETDNESESTEEYSDSSDEGSDTKGL